MKNKRYYIIGLCFWLVGITLAKADPADPSVKRLIETVDGERVEVQLIGDEYGFYWKSVVDNRCFVEAAGHPGRFSRVNPESILSKARIRRSAQEQESTSLRSTSEQGYPCAKKKLTGKQRIPALLVEFQDDRFSTPDVTATFNKLLNTKDYHEGDYVGSVKDYFLAQSNGLLELDFDIIGPICKKFVSFNNYLYFCCRKGKPIRSYVAPRRPRKNDEAVESLIRYPFSKTPF